MTDTPPPYPGINTAPMHGGNPQPVGSPAWANPEYNPGYQQTGYPQPPNYAQSAGYYNNYPQNPPPYSPQGSYKPY